ncbi:uncharacterized protein si:ch211-142k18.1 isoform X2 [Antennarius striatus]
MWRCWMTFILAWISMATLTVSQSGDWGSGFDIYSSNPTQEVGDEPERMDWITSISSSFSPNLKYEPEPDKCSVHFNTNTAAARRLKAQKEELAYLQAIQSGNLAVMASLEQFVGAEVGNQSYKDVIKENIIGIQEDQKTCHEVVKKAEEYLEKQLEGEASGAMAVMQKIQKESMAFEEMLLAAADIANRLEISSQALHASFTKQLKDKIHR